MRISTWLAPALLVVSLPAVAAHRDPITAINNSLDLSFQRGRLNYGETDATGYLDSERGNPQGFRIGLSGLNDNYGGNLFTQISYSHADGDVNYTGADLLSGAPLTAKSNATIDDYQFKLGAAVVRRDDVALIPYIGLGGHKWVRTLGVGTPGAYDETYTHSYWLLGALFQLANGPDWALTANIGGGQTMGAHIDVPDIDYAADLGSSSLWQAGLEVDYRIAPSAYLFAGADYTRYRYGQSEWAYNAVLSQAYGQTLYIHEPDSKTELTNFNLGLRFSY